MIDMTGFLLDNRYILTKKIASGGSGDIYLAKDSTGNLKKQWAVKCVDGGKDKNYIEHYKQEVALLDELNHPNIVNIIYYSEYHGCFFFVMDYISGSTLYDIIKKNGPMDEEKAAELILTICSVIGYLHTVHKRPIIYSDLKPKNIMIDNHGIPFLLDLGIAHEVTPGKKDTYPPIGTKGYAAPEQFSNGTRLVDERTDIYAIGAVLFTIISGKVPESEKYLPKKQQKRRNNIKKVAPYVSNGMEHIISKCMSPDPEKRYSSIKELRSDINNLSLLNEKYIAGIKKKLSYFYVCLASLIIGLLFIGVGRGIISINNAKLLNEYLNDAQSAVILNDIETSKNMYLKALAIDPSNIEIITSLYELLYNDTSDDSVKEAIDSIRTNTKVSALSQDPSFALKVAKDAISLNAPVYSSYAQEILTMLQHTKEYKKNTINTAEVDALLLIAKNNNADTPDVNALNKSINELINSTNNDKLTDSEKVNNYYIVLLVYNAFPEQFNDMNSYIDIVNKIGVILDRNKDNNDFSFSKKVSLCESIGNYLCDYALKTSNQEEKINYLNQALTWFNRLGNLPLDVDGYLGKGNILYNLGYYNESKNSYLQALSLESNNRTALIGVIRSDIGLGNIDEARNYFNQLVALGTDNVSQSILNQIESLQIELNQF